MLQMIKKILHPDNMLFKMVVLNCGLLLLVTIVITTAGNIIYQGSMEEHSYANTMEMLLRTGFLRSRLSMITETGCGIRQSCA